VVKFEVGQKVVVFDRHTGDRFSEVIRVTKRFVETRGGSKWNQHGHQYPQQEWSTTHITPVSELTESVIEQVRVGMHARRLSQVKWSELPLDTLRKVSALVKEGRGS